MKYTHKKRAGAHHKPVRWRLALKILRRLIVLCVGAALLWTLLLRPIAPRTGPEPAALPDGWQISTPTDQGFHASTLQKSIVALLDAPLNVHSVLVERHGSLIAEYYQGGRDRSVYGLISTRSSFNPTQLHDVRSIGKSVTSLLYGIALEQGKVPAVTASVLDAFPQLGDIATPDKQRIRVEDLLNMANGLHWNEGSPGINDELRLFWKSDIQRYVLSHDLESAPNTRFNYNGGGTAILAELISSGAQQPLDSFAREFLFQPLGITDFAWVKDVHGRPMAFNGLRLRPRDLLKIGRLMLNNGQWHGKQVVPAAWIAASMTPRFATDVRNFRYAYQWWSGELTWQGRPVFWHGGMGNGGQRLYAVPELDLVVAITAGAYDEMPTAIAVNNVLQEIVASVER